MTEFTLTRELIEICKRLHARNLLAAADGNVSYKVSESKILITPSGLSKTSLRPSDLATVTQQNQVLSGRPSSERLLHLEIYRRCPKARCVIHAHPPTAIAWSLAYPEETELPSDCLPEVILAAGKIPIAPYARPGTPEAGAVLDPFLPSCRILILAKHGAVSWGEDLMEAYNGMERIEHVAQILWHARLLGNLSRLSPDEVAALRLLRKNVGDKTR